PLDPTRSRRSASAICRTVAIVPRRRMLAGHARRIDYASAIQAPGPVDGSPGLDRLHRQTDAALGLHESQHVLIGVALDRLVEDGLGVIVRGAMQRIAFRHQLEARGLDLAYHLRFLDAMQRRNLRLAGAGIGLMI